MAGLLCNDTLAARFEDPEKANWKDAGEAFAEGALEPRRETTALGRVTAEALRGGGRIIRHVSPASAADRRRT